MWLQDIYWPTDEESAEYGCISIQLLEQETEEGVSARLVEVDCEEVMTPTHVVVVSARSSSSSSSSFWFSSFSSASSPPTPD